MAVAIVVVSDIAVGGGSIGAVVTTLAAALILVGAIGMARVVPVEVVLRVIGVKAAATAVVAARSSCSNSGCGSCGSTAKTSKNKSEDQ